MTVRVLWRPTFLSWKGNSSETPHDPDAEAAQNQTVAAIYRFRLIEYGHRRWFQSWSSPYYLRSSPRRRYCATATARGLPAPTAASSNRDTGSHRLQPAG